MWFVRLFWMGLLVCLAKLAVAQTIIEGKVTALEDKMPLEGVFIKNKIGSEWALTDKDGQYVLQLNSDNFLLSFRYTGRKTKDIPHSSITDNQLNVALEIYNLSIEEVNVVGESVDHKISSSIRFDEYAIEQVQGFSIVDVLEQLPGQTITPPSLARPKTISLRTAIPDQENSFGLSIILDGAQLTNDANMQTYSNVHTDETTYFDNVDSGIDLRQIPVENLESIEVITGVPDAKYANLTTGAIIIERKAGVMPYSFSAKVNEGSTSASLAKGFKLSDKLGNLSISTNYTNSNIDPRNSLNSFNRINTNAIWSVNDGIHNRWKNTLSLTFSGNFDEEKVDYDTDDGSQQSKYRKDRQYSLNNRLALQLNKKWIDHLNATATFSYAKQHSYRQTFYNYGGRIVPLSTETSLTHGNYSPIAYLYKKETKGEPIYSTLLLSASKKRTFNQIDVTTTLGINANYTDNIGEGKGYATDNVSPTNSIQVTNNAITSTFRPTNYNDYVNGQINYGAYIQNNVIYALANKREIYLKAGLRYDNQAGFGTFSPRVNIGYDITKNWIVRAGYGLSTKNQSLNSIFPGDNYYDVVIRDFRTPTYSWNLLQTYRYKVPEVIIKPIKSTKYEVGSSLFFKKFSLSTTGFYSKREDGAERKSSFIVVPYPDITFKFTNPNEPPTYKINGYSPRIIENKEKTNGSFSEDYGFEFNLNTKRIRSINTSFAARGAYYRSSSSTKINQTIKNKDLDELEYVYGVLKPFSSERMNVKSSIVATNHIPQIKLLVSIVGEQFWSSKSYPEQYEGVEGDIRYPIAYINSKGQYIDLPNKQGLLPEYSDLQRVLSTQDNITVQPFYTNYHLRISKEFSNGLSTNFHAYNFLNHRPVNPYREIETSTGAVITVDNETTFNQPLHFGGSIKYKF